MDEVDVAKQLMPPPPAKVGPYRIESQLGVGGMGAVYRAYDERLERPVAIKQILPEMAEDAKALKRLRREAQTVAKLNHPSIVQIYDILEREDGDWIVMELVDGQTLYSMIESEPLAISRALEVLYQVCDGLAAAHAKGIVHRDLKSENVMVDGEGKVKILDFGLAKNLWRHGDKSLSIEGSIMGTGRSMSPEQALGDTVDHRSDLFSLGSLIYETVTGQPPFQGGSIFRVLAQVCSDPHPPPGELNPELPEELIALIDCLLEKDPSKRPQTATEVAQTLEKIAGRPIFRSSGPWALPPDGTDHEGAPAREGFAGTPDATLWMHPAQRPGGERRKESTSGLHIRTLLRITLGSPAWPGLDAARSQVVSGRHDRLVRDQLANSGGLEIDKADDGFMLLFERPAEAVAYALAYREGLEEFCRAEAVEVNPGIGIHLGEMFMTENLPADVSRGAKLLEVEGHGKLIAGRAADLALGGRVLMTQTAFEIARRGMAMGESGEPELEWVERGEYLFAGLDEPQSLFEVGRPGIAQRSSPDSSPIAQRVASDGISRPRIALWSLAGIVTLALVAVWLAVTTPWKGAAEKRERRASMAVLGFQNLSGNPETGWLSTALAELFATELGTGGALRMVPGESVARMKRELSVSLSDTLAEDTLQQIRRLLGTDHVLGGSFLVLDRAQDPLRLNLRLQATGGGEPVLFHATGSESELFELVSRAAREIRGVLALDDISNQDAAAVRATLGASPEANRLYSEGLVKLRGHRAKEARDLLSRAVDADPSYALAHAALSRAWFELGYDAKAQTSAGRALELAKDLPVVAYLEIQGQFHEVAGEWDKAVDAYDALRRYYPDDIDVGIRLVEAERRAGRGREALETVRELRQLPPPARDDPRVDLAEASARSAVSDLAGSLAAAERAAVKGIANQSRSLTAEARQRQWRPLRDLGRLQEAEAALEEARALFVELGDRDNVAAVLNGEALLLEDEGRLAEAEKLFREALEIHREIGDRKGVAEGLNNLADLILDRGELLQAKEMVAQAVEEAREIGDRETERKALDTTVWVLLHLGELQEAEQRAREGLLINEELGNRGGVGWSHYYLAQVAVARGALEEARQEIEQVRAIGSEIGSNHLTSYALYCRAEIEMLADDLALARTLADESRALPSELTAAESDLLASRLFLESGSLDEALDGAQRLAADLRTEGRRDDEAAATLVLAEALWRAGDVSAAHEAVERVLEVASSSQDPQLRLRVDLAAGRKAAQSGDAPSGRRLVRSVVEEAEQLGLVVLKLQAGKILGQLELAAGDSTGQRRLDAVAAEAEALGLGLIVRQSRG